MIYHDKYIQGAIEFFDNIAIEIFFDSIEGINRLQSKLCLISAINCLQLHKFFSFRKHVSVL